MMMTNDMMTSEQLAQHEDRQLWRWGGLAGLLGSVLMIVVFVVVGVFVGTFAGPEDEIAAYPDVRVARTIENGLYLVVLVLWAVHFVALYRALRATRLAPALYGAVLGVMGMVVLAAGALPHVVTAQVSELYREPSATAGERAALVLAWQTSQSVVESLLFVGLVIAPLGLVLLGVAMVRTPAFGRVVGRVTIGLGAAGTAAAVAVVIQPDSPVAAVGFFVFIAFHLIVGRRTLRLPTTGRFAS